MTKKQLAEAAGVSSRTIIEIEGRGVSNPASSTLTAIAQALNFPVGFFLLDEVERSPLETISFRARASLTAGNRNAVHADLQLCREFLAWVEQRFDLPEPNFPDLSDSDPVLAAAELRRVWGLGPGPLPNLVHLAEAHGALVMYLPPELYRVDACCQWFGGRPIILLVGGVGYARARFDMAHEIAHLVRDRGRMFEDDQKEIERAADAFASEFLIPRGELRGRAGTNPSVDWIIRESERWLVSASALAFALRSAGLLADWAYRDVVIALSRRGYRSKDGPESVVPPESSKLMKLVFDMLREDGMSMAEVAADLQWSTEDLRLFLHGNVMGHLSGGVTSGTPPEGGHPSGWERRRAAMRRV